MKIAIFGASGRTGLELILQVLTRGHEVTALVRDPEKFALKYDRLKVMQGDALEPDSFDAALKGQDAVLSALGVTGFLNSLRPMTFYRRSAEAIVGRMQEHDIRRLMLVSSVGVLHDPTTPIWYRTIVQPMLRHKYDDIRRMEEVAAASGLDWTVVRAGRLDGGPLTQRYRVGQDGNLPDVTKISRSDLASFMAAGVDDHGLYGRTVAISY